MTVFLRVLPYVKRYPWLAIGTLGSAILGTLMVIVFPAITQVIIDDVIRQKQLEMLLPLSALGLATFLTQNVLNSIRLLFNNHFEQRLIFDLRSDLYEHIQILPLRWFDNRATGDIMTRLVEDVASVERVLVDGVEQGVVAVLQILVVAGMMFYYSVPLTFAALIPIPFLAIGALIYTLTARPRYQAHRKAASGMNSLLHDNISGIRQIKTYTSEEREHARFNKASDVLRRATLVVMSAWALYSPSMEFLASCGTLIIIAFPALIKFGMRGWTLV